MNAGAVVIFLEIIGYFLIKNKIIKEVCNRMPYTEDRPIFARSNGDGGYKLHIENITDGYYVPLQTYRILLGQLSKIGSYKPQVFTRFTINGRVLRHNTKLSKLENYKLAGKFQPLDDTSVVNKNCHNTISESNEHLKEKVNIIWKAPGRGTGCVVICAMIYEHSKKWFSDHNELTKVICESR